MIAASARDRYLVLYRLLFACGLPSVLAVAYGGLAVGTFAWSIGLRDIGPLSIVAFVVMAVLGLMFAATLWLGPPAYQARAKGYDLPAVLRSRSIAWGSLAVALTICFATRAPDATSVVCAAGAFAIGSVAVATRTSAAVRDALFSFVLTRTAVYVIGFLSVAFFAPPHGRATVMDFARPWSSWDGVHYLSIAMHGYGNTDMVFFPLYPTLIHLLAPAFGDDAIVAGLLVSNVAFFFALYYVHRIVAGTFDDEVAGRSTFLLAAFPTSLFFSATYTEALFLALTVSTIYYLQEHRWVTAGIIGGFAALTRVEGVLLVAPFVAEVLTPETGMLALVRSVPAVRRQLALGLAMIPLGLLTYMLLLWILCGDPLYFSHAQAHWSRTLSWPWIGVQRALRLIITSGNAATIGVQMIELTFSVAAIAVFACGLRWLSPAQRAYTAVSLLLPLSTSSLMSMPRFALVIFPLFTILAIWSARERYYAIMLASFLPLLGLFVTLFTTQRWVA